MGRLVGVIAAIVLGAGTSTAADPKMIPPNEVVQRAAGRNSLPGALLHDGTVCITETLTSECQLLLQVPRRIVKKIATRVGFFDGIFDLDDSGSPEVFIDYWPDTDDPNCAAQYREKGDAYCDAIALMIYKKFGGDYRKYAVLNAVIEGYAPGASFVADHLGRKAIFETRYGGSSGYGLFYLNWNKRALQLISDGFFMIGSPVVQDVDRDGNSEIFITARGYDRTAVQGAALLHWQDNTYRVWWPKWDEPPYVVWAQMVKVNGDSHKEIVALLDPGQIPDQPESKRRQLTIWKLTKNAWKEVHQKEIAGVEDPDLMTGFPELSSVTPSADGANIILTYPDGSTTTCRYEQNISCPLPAKLAK